MMRNLYLSEVTPPIEVGRPVEILAGTLFTGSASLMQYREYFTRHGIRALLSVAENQHDCSRLTDCLEEVLHIPMNDKYFYDENNFATVTEKLGRLIENHDTVMVACNMGVNRSVCCAAAYLMISQNIDPNAALALIDNFYRKARLRINPFTELQNLLWDWWEKDF